MVFLIAEWWSPSIFCFFFFYSILSYIFIIFQPPRRLICWDMQGSPDFPDHRSGHLSIYIYSNTHYSLCHFLISNNNNPIHSCQKSIYPFDSALSSILSILLHTSTYSYIFDCFQRDTFSLVYHLFHFYQDTEKALQTHRNNVSLPRFQSQPVEYQVHP